ncbi:hypothetical protein [Teredinibacter haidensis]|uniref:hypothetical protein n=1 Tax=Teredinibacter haidensis TaxID=2731755 RepID=UPI000948DE86|nr:hypothetical protein [Teredinibacter haidensis]
MIIEKIKIIGVIASLIFGVGCAHNIQVTPDSLSLKGLEVSSVSDKNVGYYISSEDKQKLVTTPGGGGDKVTYKPYADTEGALNTILMKVFSRVYAVDSLDNKDFISEKGISLIFVPELVTDSSSSSAFTWPPTDFSMNLTCTALNPAGETVWSKSVQAKGHAEFSEFTADFSLSARRASEEAFKLMLKEIDEAEELK